MDKYEISLWEDFPDIKNGTLFLNERKLCVIGSNTLQSNLRAVEPKMVNKVDGTNTFTFKMYHFYIDELTGEKFKNPFLPLLINERKVKVFWKNKWYDLVIKNIDEDSTGKGIVYTCEDLFITELSKNGYNLSFTSELQNNIGTAADLIKQVLDGSGWSYDEEGSIHVIQRTEEPVYEVQTISSMNTTLQSPDGDTDFVVPTNKKILVFYSSVIDISDTTTEKEIQFLYSSDEYQTDENEMLVVNGNCHIASLKTRKNNQYIEFSQDGVLKFRINTDDGVSTRYRAERLVKTQVSKYDKLLERYVNVYTDTSTGKQVYGYQTSEFSDPLMVINLVVNSSNFKNLDGWIGDDLTYGVFPKLTAQTDISTYNGISYLKVNNGDIYNYAFSSNKQYLVPSSGEIKQGDLGGLHMGDKYIFRVKIKNDCDDPSAAPYVYTSNVSPVITTFDSDYDPNGSNYFSIDSQTQNEDWNEYTLTCITSCPASDIEKLGLFLHVNIPSWIEAIEFFKYEVGVTSYDSTEEKRMNPGEVSLQGIEKISYKYYNIDHGSAEKPEELDFLYQDYVDSDRFVPVYNNYEKMASIEETNSNRFNIIQSIAEAFKCWIRFTINHDENGKILLNNDGTAQKYVTIVETVGKDLGWSFEYGIDLKNIHRRIISNDISTKVIVVPNENEFAKDGFCTISRSNLNYTKENFILNLDYFINQGLLDRDTLEKDLYSTSSNYIGYYYLLHKYNTEYDDNSSKLIQKQMELLKQDSQLTVLTEKNKATQEQLTNNKSDIMMLAGVDNWEAAQTYIETHTDNIKVQSLMNSISQLQKTLDESNSQISNLQASIDKLNEYINTQTGRRKELAQLTKELHERFFKKYSRFIQEGTWQDENYIDDNKYYLDAVEVAYTASRPELQYQIDIMRVSALEDFSSKVCEVGDICYVQDREFFGYNADKITPYKLKITISEITSYFDQPEKDSIKVQNYKTQFEDLFQRITATTQSLQYAQGSYQRAASAINSNNTLNFGLLQDTFDSNQDLVLNASNQQVTWDSTGITVTDNINSAQKVKLMAGGLFITNDGGATWKNAVRGDGISTDILTAGRINTNEIYIYDGEAPSFRWDNNGLTAYSHSDEGINFNKFIRYDRYGIYGYDGNQDFIPTSEEDIWNKSNFGLTWNGFFLRNQNAGTSFEISTDKDLIIKNGNINRVQIGRIDGSNINYGLKLCDNDGRAIFVVDNNGATIGGWTISSNGLIDPNNNSSLSMSEIRFNDVTINNQGINLPNIGYMSINGAQCEINTVPVIENGTQITGQITWEDDQHVQHTGQISFAWSGDLRNAICFPE